MNLQWKDSNMRLRCVVCGSDKIFTKFEASIYDTDDEIFYCLDCEIKYLRYALDESYFINLYNKNYFNGLGYANYLEDENVHRLNAKRYLDIIDKYIKHKYAILDYGCAYGFLLDEARKRGWKRKGGIEICDEARQYGLEKFGLFSVWKSIKQITETYYDICTIIGTLEHLPDPLDTLSRIHKLLNIENGYILLTVPNYDGFWPLKWRKFEHLWAFNKKALKIIVEKCGFRVIFLKNNWAYYDIEDALNKATRYFKIPFNNRLFVWLFKKILRRIKIPNNELICLAKKI